VQIQGEWLATKKLDLPVTEYTPESARYSSRDLAALHIDTTRRNDKKTGAGMMPAPGCFSG
jgi:hypothetical protein